MKVREKGVLPKSEIFFHTPSEFAKEALYYLIYSGTFHCNKEYRVDRETFENFLFIFVTRGQINIEYSDKIFTAKKNEFVFLNCNKPHKYWVDDYVSFQWFHFSGNSSEKYFDALFENNGCVFNLENTLIISEMMESVLKMAKAGQVDEHLVSLNVNKIIYELINAPTDGIDSAKKIVSKAISYIEAYYMNDTKVDDIANYVHLSTYHFIRLFKRHTNYSPYEYLLNFRMNHAKKLLKNTNFSIGEISIRCGFNSDSHFVTTFKKNTGMTPKKFREIQF